MNITVDKNTIHYLYSDKIFKRELIEFLNAIIDDEIEKEDNMDTELIEECLNLITEAEGKGDINSVIIPFVNSEKIIKACTRQRFGTLSKGVRAALIASIVLLSTMTANTVIAKVFDYNIAQEVASTISQKLLDWGIISDTEEEDIPVDNAPVTQKATNSEAKAATDNTAAENSAENINKQANSNKAEESTQTQGTAQPAEPAVKNAAAVKKENKNPVTIRLEFSKDFKTEYLWGESLDTKGLTVTAVYNGGATKQVSTSDCSFKGYNKALEGTQKIVVEYCNASATFEITLKKTTQKSERTVTGVRGTAPTKLVYTTADTAIDLRGLKVRAVYSDGTYSSEYNYKDAVVLTKVDFSLIGEQQVTVRIADLFNYTFTIMIEDIKQDDDIASIRLQSSSYHFYIGEDPDYSNINIFVTYHNGKEEYKKYIENQDDISVIGIDTSRQTLGYANAFTVYYKGHSVSARYTVESRNTVLKVEYDTNRGRNTYYHKFLYYYGEDLCLGKNYPDEDALLNLKSTNTMIDGSTTHDDLLTGTNWRFKVYWSGNTGFVCKYYEPSELDFYGYDPYTIGYQSVDVFYEGTYLTSIVVFVYGDSGYAPTKIPQTTVTFGSEEEDLKTGHWLKCLGDGQLTCEESYNDIIDEYCAKYDKYSDEYYAAVKEAHKDPRYTFIRGLTSGAVLENANEAGWQNAVVKLPTGETYSYKVCHAYQIASYKMNYDSAFIKVNIQDFANKSFDDVAFTVNATDGSVINVPASETSISYYQRYNGDSLSFSEVSPDAQINSMFVQARFTFDRSKYYHESQNATGYPSKTIYVYSEGFENAYTSELLFDPDRQDTFRTGSDADELLQFGYTFRIHAFDNYFDVDYEDVKISEIDYSKAGEYNAVFTVDFAGEAITANRTVYIVDAFADARLKIISDPNDAQNALMPGDTINIDGIKLQYTDRKGKVTPLTAEDITYEITRGGSGHIIDSEMQDADIKVTYHYINEWGKEASLDATYRPWGYIPSFYISYRFNATANAVNVSWKPVDGADYYIVTYLGETYTTSGSQVYCNKNLRNGTIYNEPVVVKPVKVVDGNKLIGCGGSSCTANFTISGYVPPSE
ncbi:MAG: bacterial Ig-like domain-containing protein [Clostridium sp.]|nr:bacterial Ig-like domain-containing protein [Clostridium sp.]